MKFEYIKPSMEVLYTIPISVIMGLTQVGEQGGNIQGNPEGGESIGGGSQKNISKRLYI